MPHHDYIFEGLKILHQSRTPFLLLRYWPIYSHSENELDIVVPPRSKEIFASKFLATLPKSITCVATKNGLFGCRLVLCSLDTNKPTQKPIVFALDIREKIIKNGVVLADYHLLCQGRAGNERNSLPVPCDSVEVAFLIARNYWSGRLFTARHLAILEHCNFPDEIRNKSLETFFLTLKSEGGSVPPKELLGKLTRLPIPGYAIFHNMRTKLGLVRAHMSFNYLRYAARRPTVIAIHGPDGVGKTTTAYLVTELLSGARVTAQHYVGGKIDSAYVSEEQGKKNVRLDKKKGLFGYFERLKRLVLFYPRHAQLYIDIMRKRSLDIVVYDRFAYDHLYKGQALFVKKLTRLIASYSARPLRISSSVVNLMLVAPPPLISTRKKEMTEEEIADYYKGSRFYFGKKIQIIDATQSPNSVAKDVIIALCNHINLVY